MKRKIYNDLLNWKENSIDTPLMIIGARQIGKTYVINEFCRNEFENYIYINRPDNHIDVYDWDLNYINRINYTVTGESEGIVIMNKCIYCSKNEFY